MRQSASRIMVPMRQRNRKGSAWQTRTTRATAFPRLPLCLPLLRSRLHPRRLLGGQESPRTTLRLTFGKYPRKNVSMLVGARSKRSSPLRRLRVPRRLARARPRRHPVRMRKHLRSWEAHRRVLPLPRGRAGALQRRPSWRSIPIRKAFPIACAGPSRTRHRDGRRTRSARG